MQFDWETLIAAGTGVVGGGQLVRLLVNRHLQQFEATQKDVHQILLDLAIVKERLVRGKKLDHKVDDLHDRVIQLESTLNSLSENGHLYYKKKEKEDGRSRRERNE